jgi:hypothetical protein
MLFTVISTSGFHRKPYSSLALKIHTKIRENAIQEFHFYGRPESHSEQQVRNVESDAAMFSWLLFLLLLELWGEGRGRGRGTGREGGLSGIRREPSDRDLRGSKFKAKIKR